MSFRRDSGRPLEIYFFPELHVIAFLDASFKRAHLKGLTK